MSSAPIEQSTEARHPAATGRLMHGASSGENVRLLQATLKALGYDPGGLDGVYGPHTAAAVRNYQQDRNLPAEGVVRADTWAQLSSERGSTIHGRTLPRTIVGAIAGDDVRIVQQTLLNAGFNPGRVDGVYGPDTANAVRTYQKVHSLSVDGIVGPETSDALLRRRLRLSPSVATVATNADGSETASSLAAAIFSIDKEYAKHSTVSGQVASVTGQPHLDPVDWLTKSRELFDPVRAPEFYGRLFAIGLSLLDDSLNSQLQGEVLDDLIAGLREPLETLLTARGTARLLMSGGHPIAERMSPSSIQALSYADRLRRAAGRNHLHTEHLLLGLNEKPGSTQRLLARYDIGAQRLAELLHEAAGWTTPTSTVLPGTLTTLPPLSAHVQQAIVNAFVFADTGGPPVVDSRHLLQGLLSVAECSVVKVLRENRVPVPDPRLLATSVPAVSATMMAGAINDTVPEPGQGRVRNADRLKLKAEVEMLAAVSLAADTPLPLAVGLFGNWGTGKSFFMAMMEERIDELAQLSRDGRPEAAPYCGQVRQVRFNAWHYVDEANLWASLAETIFEGVARPRNRTEEKLAEIDSACRALAGIETERMKLAQEVQVLADAVGRSSGVARTAAAAITAFSTDPPQIGVPAVTTEPLTTAAGKVRATVDQATTFWQLLQEEVLTRRRWSTVASLAVVVAVCLGIWLLAGWADVSKVITAVAITLSAVIGLGVRILSVLQSERVKREKPLREAERQLREVQSREAGAHQVIADRERELTELNDNGRQLHKFLRERTASVYYREKLGVISQVRRDFEHLVSLIKAANRVENDPAAAPAVKPETETRAAAAAAAAAAADIEIPAVERIILYIDDLDRCPADKVVEVLQAVHLLMAFELFVVVVGVDSRWLERSLEAHFTNLLDEPDRYLEKIFQIPFALRPMSQSGYKELIDQLTTGPPPTATPPPTPGVDNHLGREQKPDEEIVDAQTPEDASPTQVPVHRPSEVPAASDSGASEPPLALPRPEALFLSDPERDLLRRLGGIVPTPRATKRLVNTYRMLRVSVPPDELGEFEPGGGDEYQCVGLLLGILVGRPEHVKEVFGKLTEASGDENIWQLLEAFSAELEPLFTLKPQISVTDTACYQRWVGKVSRFSFRLSSLPAAPVVPA